MRRWSALGLLVPLGASAGGLTAENCISDWQSYFTTAHDMAWRMQGGAFGLGQGTRPAPTLVAACAVLGEWDSQVRVWHGLSRRDAYGERMVLGVCSSVDVVQRGEDDTCARFSEARICRHVDDPAATWIEPGPPEAVRCEAAIVAVATGEHGELAGT